MGEEHGKTQKASARAFTQASSAPVGGAHGTKAQTETDPQSPQDQGAQGAEAVNARPSCRFRQQQCPKPAQSGKPPQTGGLALAAFYPPAKFLP